MPYVYNGRFLDTQYGKRKDGDIFKIGHSAVLVDQDGDITIKEKEFWGSEEQWELLTPKTVNKEHVTSDDLRTINKILPLTNAHLEGYKPGGDINDSGGENLREIIAHVFARRKSPRCRICDTPCMEKIIRCPPALCPKKNKSQVRAWLEQKEVYTKHSPFRKRILSNTYNVSNSMDVWECDLLDVQFLAKYNKMHKHILSVIDVFSKYLHLVPLKSKCSTSISFIFRSLFHDDN